MPWSATTSPWLQNGVPKDPRELLFALNQNMPDLSSALTHPKWTLFSKRWGTIFSNTHIWVWKSDTPKSPLVYHHLLPKKKKETLWSKSPPFLSHNQRFFCACTQKDLNPVLRLRPRPKHQLGGVEGIDQHHLTAQVFNGFWMFWALKLEGSSLKYGGTKNGGTLK